MDHHRAVQSLAVECYLLGDMSPREREDFEEHFFECPVCAEDVRNATQFMAEAKDVLAAEPARADDRRPRLNPRPKRTWFAWLQPQFAAAAIALLAVVCIAETIAIPRLRDRANSSDSPRLVASAFLKPQTRGTPAILKAAAGQPLILMFDLPESSATVLQFAVNSVNGKVEFTLTSPAPAAGEMATLSIPKLELQPGSYMLVVTAPSVTGQDGQELGRFPFQLQRP